jgi:hypothetical protein
MRSPENGKLLILQAGRLYHLTITPLRFDWQLTCHKTGPNVAFIGVMVCRLLLKPVSLVLIGTLERQHDIDAPATDGKPAEAGDPGVAK